jgi:hypothetical protein
VAPIYSNYWHNSPSSSGTNSVAQSGAAMAGRQVIPKTGGWQAKFLLVDTIAIVVYSLPVLL